MARMAVFCGAGREEALELGARFTGHRCGGRSLIPRALRKQVMGNGRQMSVGREERDRKRGERQREREAQWPDQLRPVEKGES